MIVTEDAIDYIVVDSRLSDEAPVDGFYFYRGEPQSYTRDTPIAEESLNKFRKVEDLRKVYSNGVISIYDTSSMRG